jgi:Zn-dependent protease with chaperone function
MEVYRHPKEPLALALSVAVLAGLSAFGGVTVGVILILFLGFSYAMARIGQAQILRHAVPVTAQDHPAAHAALDLCWTRLPDVPVEVCVLPSASLNAYTFGLDQPYTLVLTSELVETTDVSDLSAIIGHELGHVFFEHTFLSSLTGGMLYGGGVASLLWALAFFRWRRVAELTADRVALLACGDLNTCARALIWLATGGTDQVIDVESVLSRLYADEQRRGYVHADELFQTHPRLITRLRALLDFDAELFVLDVEKWLAADSAP